MASAFPSTRSRFAWRRASSSAPHIRSRRFGRARSTVQFAAETCRACTLRVACTPAADGRSISLHPQEALLQQLRATTRTSDGRAVLRRRTTVEHSLARLDQTQGKKARYKGARKNTLDLRRCATVLNLQSLARLKEAA